MSTPPANDADQGSPTGTRRGLIRRGAVAAAGGLGLAALAADPAQAAVGTMLYGEVNDATTANTKLTSTALTTLTVANTVVRPDSAAVFANHSGGGIGVYAASDGPAVHAIGNPGIEAFANGSGSAITAWSQTGYGLDAWGNQAQLRLRPSIGASGAPAGGNHQVGEVFVDSFGRHHLCVVAGTPGTWVRPGFNPLVPFRVCDTRAGTGTPYSTGIKLGPGAVRNIGVVGVEGLPVPAGVTAVVGNLTVTGPTAGTYLTVYPADATRPTASTINVTVGQTLANQVTTKVDANGVFRVYNSTGSTHIILDVTGFFF
ncbi:MAG: hypothetical protein HOV79_11565 [Hamadaea sp.]|nr:hypothetical protein [Hamadaea sp.]